MGNFAFKEGNRDACRMWINGVEKSPLTDVNGSGPAVQIDPTCLIGVGAGPAHGFTGYLARESLQPLAAAGADQRSLQRW